MCREYLPQKVLVPSVSSTIPPQVYTLAGLHDHMRFSKYVDVNAHHFAPHVDMSVRDLVDEGTISLLTLQLYLNDDYAGGETSLLQKAPSRDGSGWNDVRPVQTGDVLLFDHKLVHRANPVVLGTKYTLRTDVFYRLSSNTRSLPLDKSPAS
jgi:predicted 2-oxoglutarate/Fe(II)-dependent dioxygenase YbiX